MTQADFEKLLSQYDYPAPAGLIAQKPASPRDSARLLVYSRKDKSLRFDTFLSLAEYLPKNAVLVFNQTKVVPARLMVKKETGGKAEILYIGKEGGFIKVIADRKLAARSRLSLGKFASFSIDRQKDNFYFLKPSFPMAKTESVLQKYGLVPLPPYIKHSPLTEREKKEKYQAIFAKTGLSVAAPTASLHFTRRLLRKLGARGIAAAFVTLNVNLGTFAPLKPEQVERNALHAETYEIPPKTAKLLNAAKRNGRPIVAVGTTVARTLESAASGGSLKKLKGETRLFIRPGYRPRFTDGLITNFHVPKSSLMMLVAAFTGREELLRAYHAAIENNFSLFSFGDGMLIV